MNTRTLLAPTPLDRREQLPTAVTRSDTDSEPRTTKTAATQQYPTELLTPGASPSAPPEVIEPDVNEAGATEPDVADIEMAEPGEHDEHPPHRTLWARLRGAFGKADHPDRETRRERRHHDDEEQHSVPQRPDFLADAAMSREMFRL